MREAQYLTKGLTTWGLGPQDDPPLIRVLEKGFMEDVRLDSEHFKKGKWHEQRQRGMFQTGEQLANQLGGVEQTLELQLGKRHPGSNAAM